MASLISLPRSPKPNHPFPVLGQNLGRRLVSLLLLGFALVCLTGCGAKGPENKLIKRRSP
ncbi:MAG: hypothetical protein HC824_12765 [Synechococcales cyanobacterium RM1_1_8]|nr:hypothetical protein [Synechococcales cyanobacterium RM1_1_8]